jgi:hypothetical protein
MTIWQRVECWLRKATRAQALDRVRAPIPTHMHVRVHTHARTHAHTHTAICNNCFPLQQWFRERRNVALYVQCLSCYFTLMGKFLTEKLL